MIEKLRPLMDVWGLLFRALGPSECFAIRGFTARWLLRILGLPAVLGAAVFLYYLFDRRDNNQAKAKANAKGNIFLAIFFCCVSHASAPISSAPCVTACVQPYSQKFVLEQFVAERDRL